MVDMDKVLQIQASQSARLENIEESCNKMEHCLLGNGKPGLVVRTDRLEQKDQFKTKMFWVIATAIITLYVTTIGAGIFKFIMDFQTAG